MAIRVIDISSGDSFTFPMLPEQLEYTRAGRFDQLRLLEGDANIPTGESSGRISFSGKLPGVRRRGEYIENVRAPGEVQKLWSGWLEHKRRLRIVVGGTPIDEQVYLENFRLTYEGGFGDCDFTISFLRAGASHYAQTNADMALNTYTVCEGDTLWMIALKMLGDGSDYTDIISANYNRIVSAGGIKPGMVLNIPRHSP